MGGAVDMGSHKGRNWIVIIAALVVIIAGIQAAAPLIVPFLLAAFIAIICLPALNWLSTHRISTTMGITIIAVSIIILGLLLGAFVGSAAADFSQKLPFYQSRLEALTSGTVSWLSGLGIEISLASILDMIDPAAIMDMAGRLVSGLGNALANTFLIILAVVFLLIEAVALPNKWKAMGDHAPSMAGLEKFVTSVSSYLAIKAWVSLATGVFIAVWLAILGVDFPLLWGLVAFLFNFVPNIGSVIAAVPAVMLALIQLGGIEALVTSLGYALVNVIMGNVIEPRVMGRNLGLSPLVVFLSLVFWGWMLGPVGMLLSVPLTIIAKLGLESSRDTYWLAVLIGPNTPETPREES
jgi:predicted PurR-regulated permease PerM